MFLWVEHSAISVYTGFVISDMYMCMYMYMLYQYMFMCMSVHTIKQKPISE